MFTPGLAGIEGDILFLDLDLVIVDDLQPFFDFPGDFCAIRDANLFPDRLLRRFKPKRYAFYQTVANTSIYRFKAGTLADVLERYNREYDSVVASYRNEQEYLSAHLIEHHSLSYWPRPWCASFKHDCVPKWPKNMFKNPTQPAQAKTIVFAGNPKMGKALDGSGGKWYRRIGPSPWLDSAWRGAD